jgi:hypothetical protein
VGRVDAAAEPSDPAERDLVAEGIGQAFDRIGTGDGIAVEVEEVVQLAEPERSVTQEDGEAGGAQRSAPEPAVLVGEGWKRFVSGLGRTPASAPFDPRPESLAQGIELVEELVSLRREGEELLVDRGQPRERFLAFEVEAEAHRSAEPGLEPHRRHAAFWAERCWHRDLLVTISPVRGSATSRDAGAVRWRHHVGEV